MPKRHIIKDIAGGLYQSVKDNKGDFVTELLHSKFSNAQSPDKIDKAIELLGVQVAPDALSFNDNNGYFIEADDNQWKQIQSLEGITPALFSSDAAPAPP